MLLLTGALLHSGAGHMEEGMSPLTLISKALRRTCIR